MSYIIETNIQLKLTNYFFGRLLIYNLKMFNNNIRFVNRQQLVCFSTRYDCEKTFFLLFRYLYIFSGTQFTLRDV